MTEIIILEGADKVGKSTLVMYLKQHLPGKIESLWCTGPPKDAADKHAHQHKTFEDLLKTLQEHKQSGKFDYVILDRSHVGEAVYSVVHGRPSPEYLPSLHRRLVESTNPLFIYIRGKRFLDGASDHDKGLDEHYKEVDRMFMDFFALNVPHRFMSVNNYSFPTEISRNEYVMNKILNKPGGDLPVYHGTGWRPRFYEEYANHPFNQFHADSALHKHARLVRGAGPQQYKVAFFGEAPGYKGCGKTGIPFYYDRSGMLLRETMDALGYNLDLCFVSNVFHLTPPGNKLYDFIQQDFYEDQREPWLWHELNIFEYELCKAAQKCGRVVWLGRTAKNAGEFFLKKNGLDKIVKTVQLYHPAYYLYKGIQAQIYDDYRIVLQNELNLEVL